MSDDEPLIEDSRIVHEVVIKTRDPQRVQRLMHAAPDLLAIAKALLSAIEAGRVEPDWFVEMQGCCQIAIDKVEGSGFNPATA